MFEKVEGHEGLFYMDTTTMPYGPMELVVPRYSLPGTYGRSEQEEAAARVITACQEAGSWCGVSVQRLHNTMRREHEAYYIANEAKLMVQQHNEREDRRYNLEFWLYVVICVITLGFYFLFGKKKPVLPDLQDISEVQVPSSNIYTLGPQPVIDGLVGLVDNGMLTVERHDGGFDVVFPTLKLLEPLDHYRRALLQ